MPKFLIIRFSSIGDIVLTSPVARWLSEQIPNAEIHFLTKKPFASIVIANPNIAKVFTIKKNTREILAELKREDYDYVIDLHNNLRSLTVKTFLQVPSFSVKKYHFQRVQMVWFKSRVPFAGHVVERYLDCLKELNIVDDNNGLDYFIPDEEKYSTHLIGAVEPGTYVALVIGAKHFTKRLPPEKLLEIITQTKDKIVLLGGKEDSLIASQLSQKCEENRINLCGTLSLHESAFMIKHAKAVITHDTGLMHIAAAFQKRIISVWGGTVPELGMTPWMPQHPQFSTIVEVNDLACRPCSKIGRSTCPQKHFRCMKDINVKKIMDALAVHE